MGQMSLIVNLFAGPGAGKSTVAAGVFHELKQRGIRTEIVSEYAKEWAWDERKIQPIDEMVIYGRQLERERRFYDKPMIVITDRPLELSEVYAAYYGSPERAAIVSALIASDRQTAIGMGASFLNVKLHRVKPYDRIGRFESEQQARAIDELCDWRITYGLAWASSEPMSGLADALVSAWEHTLK